MTTHNTHHTEPSPTGFKSDEIFQLLERNKGRLHVLEYASYGLTHSGGRDSACLVWVLNDVLADIERIGESLETL